jgi:hypothetical protein
LPPSANVAAAPPGQSQQVATVDIKQTMISGSCVLRSFMVFLLQVEYSLSRCSKSHLAWRLKLHAPA